MNAPDYHLFPIAKSLNRLLVARAQGLRNAAVGARTSFSEPTGSKYLALLTTTTSAGYAPV